MKLSSTRNLAFFVLLFFSALLYFLLNLGDEPDIVPERLRERYEAAQRIPNEVRYRIQRNWKGKGQVLVGRVTEPPEVEVSRRATIEADGSFATAVYPGRTLEFYAHGYDPLIIEAKEHIIGFVYDAGENHFEKSPSARLRILEASISLEAPNETSPQITAELRIPNDATVSRDHGHWQHRNEPIAESAKLAHGEALRLEGLSPIPYELLLQAPDYIEQRIEIDPHARGSIDLGNIELQRAKLLRFRFISQFEMNRPSEWSEPKQLDILCDGNNEFLFTDHRDKHRNRMRLRLYPEKDGVEAGFPWVPAEYYDLGRGSLDEFIHEKRSLRDLGKPVSERRLPLKDGHIYFFRHKGKEVNCLIQVEEL